MKTIYKLTTAILAVGVALSSCTKDIAADREDTGLQDGVRTIAISFDTPTKTVLGGPDGLTPQFKEGDLVMVSDRTAHEVCTVHVVNKEAYFTTNLTGKELKAAYPAKYAKLDDAGENVVDVLVPSNQTGRFEDANIAMTDEFTGNKAGFKNKTAILRFYVDRSIGVKAISISAGSKLVVGGEVPDGQHISDGRFENGEWREVDTLVISSPLGEGQKIGIRNNRIAISVSVYNPMVDSTLADLTDDPDGRICYVAIRPVESCDLDFASITSTQEVQGTGVIVSSREDRDSKRGREEKKKEEYDGPNLYSVRRLVSGASISAGKMADVFLPYYIKINVGTEQEPEYQYWGYCNVGAFLPEEPGLYFSWGNVDGHWLNGKPDAYAFTSEVYAKSPANSLDVDITPFGPNDAASAAWKGDLVRVGEVPFGWRMPTKEEFETLFENTERSGDLENNHLIINNTLKLPLSGYVSDGKHAVSIEGLVAGAYWTATYNGSSTGVACLCSPTQWGCPELARYTGLTIRPIFEPESQGLDFNELEEGGNLF